MCLGVGRLAAESNYELAVASKMTEIKWKQADLQAAQRELAILSQFLGNYDAKTEDLNSVRQQLAASDTQLASIQQDNLVKLTIRMGIETYKTVSDAVSLGDAAAGAFVTNGLTSAVGAVGLDRLSNALDDHRKAALGLDDETLLKPRTVKIKAVSDAARAAYPELARVQQTLALSLDAVKIAARMEDGTELGDTGAILRKNIMVRDEIAAALVKLDNLGTETTLAKTDADGSLPTAQADVDRLTVELATLNTELNDLKSQWCAAEDAARHAASQAALVPPVHQSPPSVSVTRGDAETDQAYQNRVAVAIRAAAQARWDTEAPALLTAIAAAQSQIATAQSNIATAMDTSIGSSSNIPAFIDVYGGNDQVDPNTTASYTGSSGKYAETEQWINAVVTGGQALPGTINQVEALTDDYTTLFNLQNQLVSLQRMLVDSGVVSIPASYYPALAIPGSGQDIAEDLAVRLNQYLNQLPTALANARTQLDQLGAATDAWSSGIGSVRTDIDGNLAAAQTALDELIARGAAWEALLAASPGLVQDFAHPEYQSRLGYFLGNTYIPVVRHAFDMPTYKASLLAAIATPGSTGLAAARTLRTEYDVLVAAAPPIKDAYDAALESYQSAYSRVLSYAGTNLRLLVYQDWSGAAAYTSTAHPVDASGVTNQEDHFLSLYNTSNQQYVTGMAGGALVIGQPVLSWVGLPRMHQLPDPGLDAPATYLPHRLVSIKAVIVEDGPTWIPLAPDAFIAHLDDAEGQLGVIQNDACLIYDNDSAAAADALFLEFYTLYQAYAAAHPAPIITMQPAGSVNPIPAGTTLSAPLSVTATGDFLSYQWSVTRWMNADYGWADISGATSRTLTTPALSETRWFRVTISNPGGSVVSEAAHVEVSMVYPTPVFTSAAAASAQVGVPFSWTFAVTPAGCWISSQAQTFPPGLTFNPMFGKLVGTPTAAGTWDLEIMASNQGTFGYQTFTLTVQSLAAAPTITTQPASQTVTDGTSVTLTVVTGGTAPLSYQWKKGGTDLAGTTDASYNIASALPADAGSYTVVVTNPAGSKTSDPAVLVVAHNADVDRDFRLGLIELTRVIELYNTRLGATRTGRYKVQAGMEDGFAQDTAATANQTLTRYHSGDSNRDGQITLGELTRVIELYNARSGTVRTGQYHVQGGTADGFAPGGE